MKNIIYSIYIENKDSNLSEKHLFTKHQLKKHYNKLIDVKKKYADVCNAEFVIYGDDDNYKEFKSKYEGYEFDLINLYKIYLWEKLGKKYDNVLHLDLDVVPNTNENFFDTFDMNKICVYAPNATIDIWSQEDKERYKKGKINFSKVISHKDKYDMYVKALCKKAMLAIDNKFDTDYFIANTAILGGNSNAISKLKFTERLDELIYVLNKAKTEKLFGEEVSKLFFANNEIFVHYLIDKDNIEWLNIPVEWHTFVMRRSDEISKELKQVKMIHLINKKFEELWQVLDV